MHALIKNSLYISSFTLIVVPLSYLVRVVMTKNLTLEEFGLFYAMLGFFELLQSVNDLGFSETQMYFIPKYIEQKRLDKIKAAIKTQLFNQIFTTFTISLVLFIAANWLTTSFFHSPGAENVFKIFILYFIAKDFLQNVRTLFFSYQEVGNYGLIEPIRFILTILLFVIALSLFRFDLIVVAGIWLSVYLVLAISYFLYFLYKHKEILKAAYYSPIKIYKEFIPFLLPTLFSNNVAVFSSKGTETLLVVIKGAAEVGLYNIARPISNLVLGIATPVADLLKPYISQINERKDESTIKNLVLSILNAGVFFLLPFSILLAFYSKESIVILFGQEFTEASMTLKVISFELFFNLMNIFVFGIVFGLGLQKKRAKIIYLSSAISVLLSLFLIPRFGAVGVAWANLFYAGTAALGGIYIIYKKIPFVIPVRNYFFIVLLSVILIASQQLLKGINFTYHSQQLVAFGFKAAFGIAIYFFLGIFIFKVLDYRMFAQIFKAYIPQRVKTFLSSEK